MYKFRSFVREELALTLQYHDTLNQLIWDGDKMLPKIQDRLLQIGNMWAEFAHIPEDAIRDIVLTGGNANYNYTPYSDLDVHILMDMSKLPHDKEFLADYLLDKKLAIGKAIEAELPLQPRIKWPNDIYLSDRKVSGLLAETVTTRDGMRIVLGIGLNVNALDFPPDLHATSLLNQLQPVSIRELDRNALANRLLNSLHTEFARIDDDFHTAIAEVRERSWLIGRQIRCRAEGREVHGRVLDLNVEGHLMLALPDGNSLTLTSAEEIRDVKI